MTEPQNGHNGNGAALVVAQPQNVALAIEQAGGPKELAALAKLDPQLAMRAQAIIASRVVDQWNPPLHPARAIAAAIYEQQTGQVCGRDFFADNRMGIVPGYRGRMKEAADRNITDYIDDYRPFTIAENEEHEIKPGDTAKVCELIVPARHKFCRENGIPFKPVLGFGIIRAHEKKNKQGEPIRLEGGYSWDRKARNRALKDALSHAGFAKTAREVIEDAQAAGYDLGHDAEFLGKLDREQAVHVAKTAKQKHAQAYQQAEAQAAELLAAVKDDVIEGEVAPGEPAVFAEEHAFLNSNPATDIPEPKRQKYAAGCLRVLCGQDEGLQAALVAWAFDGKTLAEMTLAECAGLIEFVAPKPGPDGSYYPSDRAQAFIGKFREWQTDPADDDSFGDEQA